MGACNEPPPRGLRTGKPGNNVSRHDLHRSNASMIKQKKTKKNRYRTGDAINTLYRRDHHHPRHPL